MRMMLFPFALVLCAAGVAQTGGQPPYQFSTQATVVLVPTEVKTRQGALVYGLKADDFDVEDNGVRRPVHLDEDAPAAGLSLVVLVQCGGAAAAELEKIAGLEAMVEGIAGDAPRAIAVVSYGSQPTLLGDFTGDSKALEEAMARIAPCDGGAATRDAVAYATELLEGREDHSRHAILLVSETRDHGSHAKAQDVIAALGRTNTVVNAVAFSPGRNQFLHDLKHGNGGGGPDLMPLLLMAVNAMKQNAPAELAALSGGEYANFTTRRGFDEALGRVANQIHNYYPLSFQPGAGAAADFHTLRVRVPGYPNAVVRSRASYWVGGGESVR